ncbi:MAG: alpha/beta hydrolase [Sandaracinus sp.]|nr:alpha/beta hydrolase [Sandaracinus sp.]MCB9614101.1 alpha/beta hydrolase [Sandaracinus sp.]MCB9623790.1 alpha/beta hydrolase [Sandaracinus sp.]
MTPEQWRQSARDSSWQGHRIAYHDEGVGPVLLVIHGFPTSSWDFAPIWSALTARFRVIAPDLLGFGFSAKPRDRDYSMVDSASQCAALLAELGVEEAHVFAHDYGDSVAQELLARHHEGSLGVTLRSCVFLNGGLFPEQHRARPVQKLLLTPLGPVIGRLMSYRRFASSFRAIFGPSTQPSDEELRAHWEIVASDEGTRIAHRLIRYIPERRVMRDRWVATLFEGDVPLRLINGTADPVSGGHVADEWIARRPDADVVRLEGIGHYPQLEAPERVLEAFLAFHDRLSS